MGTSPYSSLGIDSSTAGLVAAAGVDPSAVNTGNTAYPTYPNAAGVGSQTAGVAAAPVGTATPVIGAATTATDPSSRGMSPYSLLGDANYRQK